MFKKMTAYKPSGSKIMILPMIMLMLLLVFPMVSAYGLDGNVIKIQKPATSGVGGNITNNYYLSNITNNITTYVNVSNNITTYVNVSEIDPIYSADKITYSPFWTNHSLWIEQTYGKWFYNMTDPFTNWLSSFVYDYNQTTPAIDYCDATFIPLTDEGSLDVNSASFWDGLDAPDVAWLSTYNSTYDAKISAINNGITLDYLNLTGTVPVAWLSTFNSTYDALIQWGYNMTTPANSYTDTKVAIANLHTHAVANLTGTTTAVDCGASNFVTDVTMTNGALSTTCTASAGGSSFTQINTTTADKTTNNFTVWNAQAGQDIMTISITANKKANIECVLWSNSSVATVGVQYNITFNGGGTPTRHTWDIEHFTAVTPTRTTYYGQGIAGATSYAVMPTSSAGGYSPTYFHGLVENGALATVFNLKMKSEVAGTVGVLAGSWCRSIES